MVQYWNNFLWSYIFCHTYREQYSINFNGSNIQGVAKVSSCNHTTCACVNNTQRCSLCSWLEISMCNRHSGVMFVLYCVTTEIKMQAAQFRISATMRIMPRPGRICKTFPTLTHYMPLECYDIVLQV